MFRKIEKWALKRLFARIASEVNHPEIWEKYYDEIEKKVAEAIKKVLINFVKKTLNKVSEN